MQDDPAVPPLPGDPQHFLEELGSEPVFPLSGFGKHREDVGHRRAWSFRPRLLRTEPDPSAGGDRMLRCLEDEENRFPRPQSREQPSPVDGVVGVELAGRTPSDGREHLPSVSNEGVQVGDAGPTESPGTGRLPNAGPTSACGSTQGTS